MKGINRFRKFASESSGKEIVDMIEALYFLEPSEGEVLDICSCCVKYNSVLGKWLYDDEGGGDTQGVGQSINPSSAIDGAVSWLMNRDFENKWMVHEADIRVQRKDKRTTVFIELTRHDEG